jgi:putative addiction module component (TIGR02574 family)
MAVDIDALSIDRLSVVERLELIDRIWESLPESLRPEDVPAWHLAEIERRRVAAEQSPNQGKPWREVLDHLGPTP